MSKIKSRHLKAQHQLNKVANFLFGLSLIIGVIFMLIDPAISLIVVFIFGIVACTFKVVNYFEIPKVRKSLEEGIVKVEQGEYLEKWVCDKTTWEDFARPKFESTQKIVKLIYKLVFISMTFIVVMGIVGIIAYNSSAISDAPLAILGGFAIFIPIMGFGATLHLIRERNQWQELLDVEDESVRTLYIAKDFWVFSNNFEAIPKDQCLNIAIEERNLRLSFRKGKYFEFIEFPIPDGELQRANEIIRELELRNKDI